METDEKVLLLLAKLRVLLALKDNDFIYSRWSGSTQALSEFDAIVASRNTQDVLDLLLPTGSLQEVSLSSGWGSEFVQLADVIEEALNKD